MRQKGFVQLCGRCGHPERIHTGRRGMRNCPTCKGPCDLGAPVREYIARPEVQEEYAKAVAMERLEAARADPERLIDGDELKRRIAERRASASEGEPIGKPLGKPLGNQGGGR